MGADGEALAATSRVVLPLDDRLLPTEAAFDLTVPIPKSFVDLGRMVVAANYRDGRHRVWGEERFPIAINVQATAASVSGV